ncbi:MAG: ComF family protein [Myxococcales bacterium]|nr:ComF family protein [Myxococcales bacterium]
MPACAPWTWIAPVLNALFPAQCAACEGPAPRAGLCARCLDLAGPREGPRCRLCDQALPAEAPAHRCGRCLTRPPGFDQAWGIFDYAGPFGDALRRGKYGRRPEVVAGLGRALRAHLPGALRLDPPLAVVPVALHPRRVAARRFDVPLVLAHGVAASLGVPLARRALRRIHDTPEQAGLDEKARRRNVRDAFRARGTVPADVLLVDDVITTGATVDAAARALRQGGAERVRVLAAALVTR